jgi:serine/threonine protein kinase
LVGTQLDKYELLQKIGEGGMATVYRGRHTTLDREVAIKILHPHISASPRNRKRFAREARAIEHLDHANILKIYDYSGVDASNCYIVTEFVEGQTIQELLDSRGLLPSEVVAMIGVDLLEALEYAHRAGIIHRDLKAENVMIRADGGVKLMDFGIARFLDESTVTMTGALVGSPAYMSPEQALERPVDARSDLFSLGTLLFHMITGRLPFTGTNPSVILRNIIEGNRAEVLEIQPGVSPRLAGVVERLLQVDVESRYESAAQVREALAELLEEAGLVPRTREWDVQAFLADPDAYEFRLRVHLDRVLLERGRLALNEGDHLGAQRLFNRLLAFDPNHPQVLELLSNLHQPQPAGRGRAVALTLGSLLALALGVGAWMLLKPPATADIVAGAQAEQEAVAAAADEDPQALTPPTAPPDEAAEEPIEPDEEESARPDPPPVVAEANPSGVPRGLPQRQQPPTLPAQQPAGAAGDVAAIAAVTAGGERQARQLEEGQGDGLADLDADAGDLAATATIVVKLAHMGWAYVVVDDQNVGRITGRREFKVSPGEHVLTLQNPFAHDYSERFTIAAEETLSFDGIVLQRKPVVVIFPDSLSSECVIWRASGRLFTVGDLGSEALRVQDPADWREVAVECPGQPRRVLSLETARPGDELVFPAAP